MLIEYNKNWFQYDWRYYQKKCFRNIRDAYLDDKITEQMVVQAGGTGKRAGAVEISNFSSFRAKPSLFLAHREELIFQAVADFEKCHGFNNVGVIKGKRFEIDKRVVIASPQTLANRLHLIDPDHFGLVQADEVHNYMAKSFIKCIRHFNHKLFIGWTATPYRLDGLSLSNLVEKIVFEYNTDQAIRDGYLAELHGIRIKTNLELKGVHKQMGDFNQKQLEETVDIPARNNLIAAKYKEFADGRQFVAFGVTIKHCENLAYNFEKHGYKVAVVSANTKNRKEIDQQFREKKLDGLVNVNIYTEGWDYSDVGAVINASPTMSLTRYLQRVFRGTRLKSPEYVQKFGQNCIILDAVDDSAKHNLINTWELDRGKKASEKLFVTSEQREKLQLAEDERAKRKFTSVTDKDTKVDLLKLPKVSISGSPKMLEPATEAQIRFMQSIGVYQEGVEYTKALASEAISNAPAYPKQMRWLKEKGYDVSGGATIGQYQKALQKYEWDNRSKVDEELLK